MRLHSFQELVTRIAHLSTRDGKPCKVTFGGNDAWASPGEVHLPALPAGTFLSSHEFNTYMGYTLHEAYGHQAHTDLTLYETACRDKNDKKFAYVLNVLEDIRVENLDILRYPGDRKYLDAAHQFVDDKIPKEFCQNPKVLGLVYKYAFVHYRNLDTSRIQGELETQFPKIANAMEGLSSCNSTLDCISLAEIIVELLSTEGQSDNNKAKSDDGSNQDRGQSPTSDTSGTSLVPEDTRPEPDDPDEGNRNTGPENTPQTECSTSSQSTRIEEHGIKDNTSQSLSQNGQTPEPKPKPINDEDAAFWQDLTEIKNLLQNLEETVKYSNNPQTTPQTKGTNYFPPADLSLDRIFVPGREDLPQYLLTRAQLSSQILALKKMFRVQLQAQSKKSWLRGLDDGEILDRERLHIVASGQNSIFKEKHDRNLIDTAVELMVDLSHSMREETVRAATIVLSEALSTIPQIKLSICGFSTRRELRSHKRASGVGRLNPMEILIFKDYSESYNKCRGRLGAIGTAYNTPLGEAYGKALEHILPRREPRKIIFLITDGEPFFLVGDWHHSDYPLMQNIHKACKRLKIETLGLGIGRSDQIAFLKKYVDKFADISNIGTLPQALMQVLKGAIR